MNHKWNDRAILDPKHHDDLERAAAGKEFSKKMPRKDAEDAAYAEYKHDQHLEGAGHHLASLRLAVQRGEQTDAKHHNALLKMHMQKLGHSPHQNPPSEVQHAAGRTKVTSTGRRHASDELVAHGPMGKTEREALGCWPMVKADEKASTSPNPSVAPPSGVEAPQVKTPSMPSVHGGKGNAGEGKDAGPQHFNIGSIVLGSQRPGTHIPVDWLGTVTAHHLIKIHDANGFSHHKHFYEIQFKTPEGKLVEDFLPQDLVMGKKGSFNGN